jgi:uncharacterized membrane protein
MLLIGIFSFNVVQPARVTQFQVTITNLIAGSLILTGTVQLAFTRFVADRLFEHKPQIIVGNYHALLLAVVVVAGFGVLPFALLAFPDESRLYAVLFVAGFVILSAIWIATVFLAGIKQYKAIVFLYLIGYGLTVLGAIALRRFGLEGLLGGFEIGQLCLFCGMHALIVKNYPTPVGMSFEFFDRSQVHLSLAGVGFLYNFGTWIDKFMFWHWLPTSQEVIGPLRASVIPTFRFSWPTCRSFPAWRSSWSASNRLRRSLRRLLRCGAGGGSLQTIERHRNGMVRRCATAVRHRQDPGHHRAAAVRVGRAAAALAGHLGPVSAAALCADDRGQPAGAVPAILTVYFYLDKRTVVLALCGLFVVLNASLTAVSIALGPAFYNYGFALALLVTVVTGFKALERSFGRLEYSTFMLQ